MKRVLIIFSLISGLCATTINIPSDYATIQEGIDASVDGDTVLIAQGTYYENLILEKEIALASHAINDDLGSDWLDNVNIQETVISGAQEASDPNKGSCLVIRDGNIQPTIIGLTFQDGVGTSMQRDNCGFIQKERSGGAILIFKAYPTIMYNRFLNNGFSHDTGGNNPTNIEVANGGAIGHYSSEDIEFDEDRNSTSQNTNSSRTIPGTLNIQNNYFEGNRSGDGENFYSHGYEGSIDVSHSVFEDIDCETNSVNDFVLRSLENTADYVQNEISGNCIESNSFYVSNSGDDNNAGTVSEPFKTIGHALTLVKDGAIATTINLASGVYSRSTNGETFPIVLPDKAHLIGEASETTILDAEANEWKEAAVMIIKEVEDVKVANLTLSRGYAENHGCTGGGALLLTADAMFNFEGDVEQNNTVLENVIIENSHALNGGGLALFRVDGPVLNNVTIKDNTATTKGGGIVSYKSTMTIKESIVSNNSSFHRGGIYAWGDATPEWGGVGGNLVIEDCIVTGNVVTGNHGGGIAIYGVDEVIIKRTAVVDNHANNGIGGILVEFSDVTLENITVSGNSSTYGGSIGVGEGGNVNLTNSILWGNTDGTEEVDGEVLLELDGSLTSYYNNIEGGYGGFANIDADPLFTNPDSGDFTLQQGSPCIDAGTADLDWDGIEDITDYFGSAPDMGAYEYFIALGVDNDGLPTSYMIHQNYPNPFNPVTTLRYDLPEDALVNITIYDMMGRQIRTLISTQHSAGYKSVQWNATNDAGSPVSAGLYFYMIQAGDFKQTKKMMLVK